MRLSVHVGVPHCIADRDTLGAVAPPRSNVVSLISAVWTAFSGMDGASTSSHDADASPG